MSSTVWDPFNDLEEVLSRFRRPAGRGRQESGGHETVTTADWVPAVDIGETAEGYVIKVELPEVRKEDVKLSVNAGALLIHGTRNLEKKGSTKYHRIERGYGTFARSFSLPDDVEEEGIAAEHKEGMLIVHLPKHAEPPAKSIEIKVK